MIQTRGGGARGSRPRPRARGTQRFALPHSPGTSKERSILLLITAAVMREKGGKFTLEDIELEAPRDDEVLIRHEEPRRCATPDTSRRATRWVPAPLPRGVATRHEGAGIVEQVGSRVSKLKPGDHVVMGCNFCATATPARPASPCTAGTSSRPTSASRAWTERPPCTKGGDVVHGAFFNQSSFATYALGTERSVVKIPSDVPLEIMGPLAAACRPARARSSTRCARRPAIRSPSMVQDRSASRRCSRPT